MRRGASSWFAVGMGVVFTLSGLRADAGSITLPTTIRDFTPQTHPDFERGLGDDRGIVTDTLGPDNKPVYNSANSNPTITSGARFDQFYRDVPGVNITIPSSIVLNETSPGSGIYRYVNNSYFPIDGQGFGNYSGGHNYHFTTEIHTQFTYVPGQSFSFTGDDDVWVFINKKLVIDLGGVHGPESATILLNSLGLTTGNVYQLDVFQAERHTTGSNFVMETSIVLEAAAVPEPSTFAAAALGALGLAFARRRLAK